MKRNMLVFLSCFISILLVNCVSTVYFKGTKNYQKSELAKLSISTFINIISVDGEKVKISASVGNALLGLYNTLYINEGSHVLTLYYYDGKYKSVTGRLHIVVEKGKEYKLSPVTSLTSGSWGVEFIFKEIEKPVEGSEK